MKALDERIFLSRLSAMQLNRANAMSNIILRGRLYYSVSGRWEGHFWRVCTSGVFSNFHLAARLHILNLKFDKLCFLYEQI